MTAPNTLLRPDAAPSLPTMDPREAAASALATYLLGLTFLRASDDPLTPPLCFQLQKVMHEWPEPGVALEYPSASIIDYGAGNLGASNFTPVALEDSFEVYGPGTVVWKLGELEADFQVDIWCNDKPTRDAIAGGLMRAFAPSQDMFGVFLRSPEAYFPRTDAIRATLLSYERADDVSSVYTRERRLMAIVRVQSPILDLRSTSPGRFVAQSCVGPAVETDPCKET